MTKRELSIQNSALWSAYGDALGFITELAPKSMLKKRAGRDHIERTQEWTRVLPLGHKGLTVKFPSGSYSDDTQLRLATSRSIRGDGSFDAAAFAKVELSSWTNYCLGAGIGTREAANNLTRPSVQWYSNFFETKRASYSASGGNGAAMRIQPHVWAHAERRHDEMLRQVVRNAVVTHGNPRAIAGAVLHAISLADALRRQEAPDMFRLRTIIEGLRELPEIISSDKDLRIFWLPTWTLRAKDRNLAQAFDAVVQELLQDLDVLHGFMSSDVETDYLAALEALRLLAPETRGSGSKTALAASWLSHRCNNVERAIVISANALGSDTDSIATMAGAILGAAAHTAPPGAIQDSEYIASEALRVSRISDGLPAATFSYPDLRAFTPAKTGVDMIVRDNESLIVSGLGRAVPMELPQYEETPSIELRWLKLDFGQTILARVRKETRKVESTEKLFSRRESALKPKAVSTSQTELFDRSSSNGAALESVSKTIIDGGFNPKAIGEALLKLSAESGDNYLERGVALSAIIMKAYRARLHRGPRK